MRVLVRLGLAQAARHLFQQRPRDLRMLLDERAELPGRQPVAAEVGGGHDGRAPRSLVDERDLAEEVTGAERRSLVAADADRRVPVGNDEEARSRAALLRDRGALGEGPLLEVAREPFELAVTELGEEGDLPQC